MKWVQLVGWSAVGRRCRGPQTKVHFGISAQKGAMETRTTTTIHRVSGPICFVHVFEALSSRPCGVKNEADGWRESASLPVAYFFEMRLKVPSPDSDRTGFQVNKRHDYQRFLSDSYSSIGMIRLEILGKRSKSSCERILLGQKHPVF